MNAHIAGPYWVSTATNGEHHVCGRHGAVMFKYPAHQIAAATEHARRLQAGYTKADKAKRDAAPALFDALDALFASYKDLADSGDAGFWSLEDTEVGKLAIAALALARGQCPLPHPAPQGKVKTGAGA